MDELLLSESPDVLLCTETWLSEEDPTPYWFPSNYNVYRKDRQTRGGGVLVAVRDSLTSEEINTLGNEDLEACFCKVKSSSDIYCFSCFYGPPDDKMAVNVFCEQARDIIPKNTKNIVIAGDFNLPELKWHDEEWRNLCSAVKPDSLQSLIDEFGLEQIVETPTRGENCLDLIFTSVVCAKETVSVEPGVSDHSLVRAVFPASLVPHAVSQKTTWRFDLSEWDVINQELETCYTTFIEGAPHRTVNENWLIFKHDIVNIVEIHTPHYVAKQNRDKPWVNTEIKKAIRKSKRLRHKARTSFSPYLLNKVKDQKNIVKNMLRQGKENYMNSLEETFTKNPKRFWSYVKQSNSRECGIQNLLNDEGDELSDDVEKADHFNHYFKSVFTKPLSESKPPNLPVRCDDKMADIDISYPGVLKLINNLKDGKAAGPDGIVGRMLKGTQFVSARYLRYIYKQSLEDGSVPDDWKLAAVVPVYKSGKKNNVKNYRPISLTSICCKMLEHIIVSNLVSHLEENSLLSSKQFGFRKGSSCEMLLVDMIHNIAMALDCGATVDVVAIDMAKAFDTVPHDLLILKLQSYNVSTQVVDWFQAFLMGRKQFVALNGKKSCEVDVLSGVPQGSVCGPILFLIYVNDLTKMLTSNSGLFADDSSIYRPITCEEHRLALQEDLDRVAQWCHTWRMNLNTDKTKVLSVSRNKYFDDPEYRIGGEILEVTDKISVLGVSINNKLKWNDHVSKLCAKTNSDVRFINRVLHDASPRTREVVFNALVKSKLDYCNTVWDPSVGYLVDELEKVQRRGARMVFGDFRRDSCVTEMINRLEWQPLQITRRERRLGLFYKIYHGETILDPGDYIGDPDYMGRHDHSKKVKRFQCERDVWAESFFPRTIRDWNDLDEESVTAPSYISFAKNIVSQRTPAQCSHTGPINSLH